MSKRLTIRLLGNVSIELEGKPIVGLPSRKAEALLVYLVCHERPFPRELLADLLWDDRPQKQALANLRSILSSLRRVFGPYLAVTRQTVAFNHDSDYCLDTAEFERLLGTTRLETTRRHDDQTTRLHDDQTTRLKAAIALYRGDFLAGFHLRESRGFEEWATLQRERWQRTAVTILRQLVGHALDNGRYQNGVELADRLLTLNPFSEESHRQKMLLLARAGQHNGALRQYQTCRQLLADDLNVAPTAKTTALFWRIHSARDMPPPNLPPPFTPFVGRQADMAELYTLLTNPTCRLITLLGPGGMGKTRLALQVARQIAADQPGLFLHGIRFVPLTAVPSAPFFLPALADALELPTFDAADPLNYVINYLREKEILLLLDNFEHLLGAADALAVILQNAPLVRLLVTSQERLNLREERLFDLHGLSFPQETVARFGKSRIELPIRFTEEKTAVSPESFSGVQLFLQHIRRLRCHFQPTGADFQAIIRICRLVDGMPLAIELAAAATRRHTCPEIADQLAQNLDSLTGSLRNLPPRHRSLQAVFDYSWQLLTGGEQTAVKQLSVFRGPMTKEAARQVAGAAPAMLESLADKSFLHLTGSQQYTMHGVVRQFAATLLAARPQLESVARNRHGRYYAQFLHEQVAHLHGPAQKEALTAVGAAIDDVRAAWDWIVTQARWDDLSLALDGLYWFYWMRDWAQVGEAALGQVAAALAQSGEADTLLLARVQARQANLKGWLSHYAAAQSLLARCLPVLRKYQAWDELGWALTTMGELAYWRSLFPAARQHYREALALFQQAPDRAGEAYVLNSLGNVASDADADYAEGNRFYEQSLSIYRELGNRMGQSKCLINLGANAQMRADFGTARQFYQEGIAICRALGNRAALAIGLNNLGQLEADEGAFEAGERLLLESLEIKREIGERRSIAYALEQLATIAYKTGRFEAARSYFEEALIISQELAARSLMASVLTAVSGMYAAQGKLEMAGRLLATVLNQAAHDQEIINKASQLWDEVTASLPPDEVADCRRRGEEMGLETAVTETLARYGFTGAPAAVIRADEESL